MNSRNTFYTINLTLVFILGVAIVRTFFLPDNLTIPQTTNAGTTTESSSSQDASSSQNTSTTNNYDAIVASPLFSNQNTSNGAAQQTATKATITPPALKLTGTVAGPPSIARAIITDLKTNHISVCKVGSTIAGATIVSIEKNLTTLSIDGQDFTLEQSTGESKTSSGRTPKDINSKQTSALSLRPAPPKKRSELFDEIMKTATFEPQIVNGQSTGLKIDGLEETFITGFLGLQNGDVIQTVNGQKFTNKQKAFQVLKKARMQSHIDIQLLRNDQPKFLTFPLR